MSNRQWDEVQHAFVEHGVIFFRDQQLTPEQHIAFARALGADQRQSLLQGRRRATRDRRGPQGARAEDQHRRRLAHRPQLRPEPALGSILLAREVPERGGDTLFASMYAAYDALSHGLKKTLRGPARGAFELAHVFGAKGANAANPEAAASTGNPELADAGRRPPGGDPHPESGRKALYVNPAFTLRFEGWTDEESRPLLEYLYRHAVAARVHLPLPLAPGLDRLLGQSRDLALRRSTTITASAG